VHATSDHLAGLLSDAERGPEVEFPAVPTAGSDPDADEAELFDPTSLDRHFRR